MSLEKILKGTGKILEGTEKIVNFLPRAGARLGGRKNNKTGKLVGLVLGYCANVTIATALAPAGVVYAVAVASPVLGGYKKAKEYISRRENPSDSENDY